MNINPEANSKIEMHSERKRNPCKILIEMKMRQAIYMGGSKMRRLDYVEVISSTTARTTNFIHVSGCIYYV